MRDGKGVHTTITKGFMLPEGEGCREDIVGGGGGGVGAKNIKGTKKPQIKKLTPLGLVS